MRKPAGLCALALSALLIVLVPAIAQEDGPAAVAEPVVDLGAAEMSFTVGKWALLDRIVITDPNDKGAEDSTLEAPEGTRILVVSVTGALSVQKASTVGLWPASFACWPEGYVTPIATADGLVRIHNDAHEATLLGGGKWACDSSPDEYLSSIITKLTPRKPLRFALVFRVPEDVVVDGTWQLGLMRRETAFAPTPQ